MAGGGKAEPVLARGAIALSCSELTIITSLWLISLPNHPLPSPETPGATEVTAYSGLTVWSHSGLVFRGPGVEIGHI